MSSENKKDDRLLTADEAEVFLKEIEEGEQDRYVQELVLQNEQLRDIIDNQQHRIRTLHKLYTVQEQLAEERALKLEELTAIIDELELEFAKLQKELGVYVKD